MTGIDCRGKVEWEKSGRKCESLGWREKPGMFECAKALAKCMGMIVGSLLVVCAVLCGFVLAIEWLVN